MGIGFIVDEYECFGVGGVLVLVTIQSDSLCIVRVMDKWVRYL